MKKIYYTALILIYLWQPASVAATDYYVAKTGDDGNTGTLGSPFLTIQKAADVMGPGDDCYIRNGTYREMVTVTGVGPMSFQSEPGQNDVVISGNDVVTPVWTSVSGSIYKASTPMNPTAPESRQVFIGGRMITEARYPNLPTDFVSSDDLLHVDDPLTTVPLANTHAFGPGVQLPATSPGTITGINNFNHGTDYWKGGWIWMDVKSFWGMGASEIYASGNGTLNIDNLSSWNPGDIAGAYILGVEAEMDKAYEWYYNEGASELSIFFKGGDTPSSLNIEAKQRIFGFNVFETPDITIQNLQFFACGILGDDSDALTIDQCVFQYAAHHGSLPAGLEMRYAGSSAKDTRLTYPGNALLLVGDDVTVKNSIVRMASVNGIKISGNNGKIINCVVRDTGYLCGTTTGAIQADDNALYERNTIRDAGRMGIRSLDQNTKALYNDVSGAMALTSDGGAIKAGIAEDMNIEIAYNWVSNDRAIPHEVGETDRWGKLIDFDGQAPEFATGILAHHNVLWGATKQSFSVPEAEEVRFYNNTIFNANWANSGLSSENDPYPNVHFFNNLVEEIGAANMDMEYWEWPRFTFETSRHPADITTHLEDAYNYDFTLKSGSSAIDAGQVIPGITDFFAGANPDQGAYESGTGISPWVAGARFIVGQHDYIIANGNSILPGAPDDVVVAAGVPIWSAAAVLEHTGYVGLGYDYTVVEGIDIIDPEGDDLTLSLIGAPVWLSITEVTAGNWMLEGVPTGAGLQSFRIKADDGSNSSVMSIDLTVSTHLNVVDLGPVLEASFTGATIDDTVTALDSNDSFDTWTAANNGSIDPGGFLELISGPANSRAVAISIQSGQPGYDDIGANDTLALTSGDYELRFDLDTANVSAVAAAKVGVNIYTVVQDSSGNVNQVTLKLSKGSTPVAPESPVLVGTAQSTLAASMEWTSDTSGSFVLPFQVASGEDVILQFWALQDAEITSLDNVILYKLLPDMDSYLSWMKAYTNTLTALEQVQAADPDFDSYDNLAEYALGMIPDSSDAGTRDFAARAVENGTNYFKYIYHRRTDDDTLTYLAIERTDLIYSSATTNEPDVQSTGAVIDNFEPVTNYYEIDAAPSTFIQLKIQKD